MKTITLTDSPRVVDLKREFRQLDERTEVLKAQWRGGNEPEELTRIRQRKATIAMEIFKQSQDEK